MREQLLDILQCPRCKKSEFRLSVEEGANEHICTGFIQCLYCDTRYEIRDGIPILWMTGLVSNPTERAQRLKQIAYFAKECDSDFEIHRPRGCGNLYDFLVRWKFQNAIEKLPFSLRSKTVLDICCGSGMFSELYANKGAHVIGLDISFEVVMRAKRRSQIYGFDGQFVVGDSHFLPFRDRSFDISSVHDGLHHLQVPREGIRELCRVARDGLVIIEAAAAAITKIAIALGIAQEFEDSGNYVYRFGRGEIGRWLTDCGFEVLNLERYLMWYPHQPGPAFRSLDSSTLFAVAKKAHLLGNQILGQFGNKLQVVAIRSGALSC